MQWNLEHTDTFGGEANYSWLNRESIDLPDNATDRQVVIAAKAALGLTGVRCRRFDMGEGFSLHPVGCCEVAFVLPSY